VDEYTKVDGSILVIYQVLLGNKYILTYMHKDGRAYAYKKNDQTHSKKHAKSDRCKIKTKELKLDIWGVLGD